MAKINPDAFRRQLKSSSPFFDEALSDAEIEELVTLHERGFTDDQIVEFIARGLSSDEIPPPATH